MFDRKCNAALRIFAEFLRAPYAGTFVLRAALNSPTFPAASSADTGGTSPSQ